MLQIISDIFGLNFFIPYIYAHNFTSTISYLHFRSLIKWVDVQVVCFDLIFSIYLIYIVYIFTAFIVDSLFITGLE